MAGAAAAENVDATCAEIETHFARNDLVALAALEVEEPRWAALQQFRLAAAYIPADDQKKAGAAIREGLQIVSAELKADKNQVEMLIMGAMLDGQYLLLQPWRFFWNGRRGLSRIGRAERLDPENPRIALVRGTAKLILPRILGGSAREAELMFKAALDQERLPGTSFKETSICEAGEWGQVDIMNWLARAYSKQGDARSSEKAFQQALTYSPENYWVELATKGEGYEWTQEP